MGDGPKKMEGYTETRTKTEGPYIRTLPIIDGRAAICAASEAARIVFDQEGPDPLVICFYHVGAFGYFMAWQNPADLEAHANQLLDAAKLLRVKPKPEPELRK